MPRRILINAIAVATLWVCAAIWTPASSFPSAAPPLSRPAPAPPRAEPRFEFVSRSLLQSPARGAAFFDGGIVLAAGGALAVVPAGSDPREAVVVHLEGEPLAVAAGVTSAWVAARGLGLVTIDLADPRAPATALAHANPRVYALAVSEQRLLLADTDTGLSLFDLGDPLRPRLVDARGPGKSGLHLSAAEGLFAAAAQDSIELLSVTDAGTLAPAGAFGAGAPVRRCVFAGSVLLALGADGTVRRWDTADPRSPQRLQPLPERRVQDIAFDGERILVLRRDGVIVSFAATGHGAAAAAPDSLSLRHALSRRAGVAGSARFPGLVLCARGGRLVLFGGENGFRFFELAGAEAREAGTLDTAGFAIDVRARNGYVYLANGRGGLHIGRLEAGGEVDWTEVLPVGDARGIAFAGDLLVVAAGSGGALFYRLEAPGSPVLIGRHDSPFYLSAVATSGTTAFFAGGLGGAEAVDFSDPAAARLVWRERLSEVRGIDTDGRHLYVCDGFEGFKVYALGPKGRPSLLAALDTPGWNCWAHLSGSILYLAEGGRGFLAVDVSDPAAPVALGTAEVGAIARSVHARGTTVFVAAQMNGIAAVDASDPRRPAVAARYLTVGDARGVFADERFVYLAGGSGGLYIFRYHE